MFGVTYRGADGRLQQSYYNCHGKDCVARGRDHRCSQTPAKVEGLDTAVWELVAQLLDNPTMLVARLEERAKRADGRDANARVAEQERGAQLRRIGRAEQRLLDAYQAEAIDRDELK